jgi:methylated-DNA-[protein]-cysteine S-methyltransferase
MLVGRSPAAAAAWDAKLRAPFAVVGIRTCGTAVTQVSYLPLGDRAQMPVNAIAEQTLRELQRYLADPEFEFTVPLAPLGTAFQQRVWNAIRAVPRGESRTYGEIARSLVSAPRAVGRACGANRIALIIPCHRVVGSRGSLGGFMNASAGDPIAVKRWLLQHEGYRFGA